MNITLQKEILHLRMSVKQELWLGKGLELTVKFKLFFCLLMFSVFNACHLHSVSFKFMCYLITGLNTEN